MKSCRFILALAALLFTAQVSAVALNSGKEGQVLIFPYYSNLGGNQTLIQISNADSYPPIALKFHFRDREGSLVLSFNLYLAEDLWTAAIASVDGEAVLILPDDSCTVPNLKQTGNTVQVPLTSGFFEVIEMGVINDQASITAARNFDCNQLVSMWEPSGVWSNNDSEFELAPPDSRLRGTAQLINVQEGTLYSFVATALTEFSNIPQHTGPESEVPNLSTPHDAGTPTGNTMSIRCGSTACSEETWVRPRDAVAAVLTSNEMTGEYTNNDAIGAKAEFILTFPLQPYRTTGDRMPNILLNIGGFFGAAAGGCIPLLSLPPCEGDYQISSNQAVFLASFNDKSEDLGALVYSDILKDSHLVFFPKPDDSMTIPITSNFGVYLPLNVGELLIGNSGTAYAGFPVIGYVLQKYINGELSNGQGEQIKASYGNAFELSK